MPNHEAHSATKATAFQWLGVAPHRLPLIPDIPEGVLPIGTPCEPTRKDYVYITGYRAQKLWPTHTT